MTLRRMGERLMEQVTVTEARGTEVRAADTAIEDARARLAKSLRATWRDAAVQADGIHFSWGIERKPMVAVLDIVQKRGAPAWRLTLNGMMVMDGRPVLDTKKAIDDLRAVGKALMGGGSVAPGTANAAAPSAGAGGRTWFVGEPPGAASAEADAHASMYRQFQDVIAPKAKKVAAALGAKKVELDPAMRLHGIANTFQRVVIADIPGFGKYVVSNLGKGLDYRKLGVWDDVWGNDGVELPWDLWDKPVDKIVELIRAAYAQIAGKGKAAEQAAKMDKLWGELVARQERYGSADPQFQTMLAAYQAGLHKKG